MKCPQCDFENPADIYSLGVILYEVLTGRVPFEGDTALSIALKHKSEVPRDPREINAQIPEELSQLILRCMEKDSHQKQRSSPRISSSPSPVMLHIQRYLWTGNLLLM